MIASPGAIEKKFKVLEISSDGWIRVSTVDKNDSTWLNTNHVMTINK